MSEEKSVVNGTIHAELSDNKSQISRFREAFDLEQRRKRALKKEIESAIRNYAVKAALECNGDCRALYWQEVAYRMNGLAVNYGAASFEFDDVVMRLWEEGLPEDVLLYGYDLFPPVPKGVDALLENWRDREAGIEGLARNFRNDNTQGRRRDRFKARDDNHLAESDRKSQSLLDKLRAKRNQVVNGYLDFLQDKGFEQCREPVYPNRKSGPYLIRGINEDAFVSIIDPKKTAEMLYVESRNGNRLRGGSDKSFSVESEKLFERNMDGAGTKNRRAGGHYGFEKRLGIVRPDMVDRVSALVRRFPNMSEVIDAIADSLSLNFVNKTPYVKWQPILLDGPPGVGKTAFARALAEELDLSSLFVDCSRVEAAFELFGANATWNSASAGSITGGFARGRDANMICMLDEIDKARPGGTHPVQPSLNVVLEPSTATAVEDGFLNMAFDMSYVNWICTSNQAEYISSYLLSRMQVFRIEAPTSEQMPDIMQSVWAGICEEYPEDWKKHFAAELTPNVIEVLMQQGLPPRIVRRVLIRACARQARREMRDGEKAGSLLAEMVDVSTDDLISKKRAIGFTD